ncbi:ABC transporter ATP-binding protein [Bradyrhizobium commune]|uniref:ABC transporter ATP-binding protein n=1 Tax=Bradyrhizobium commune TaxID=83627 RepID=A0A7S9D7E6_9BRAD|nr:ABC transporter ATP-binding protein [Bradyrhizobium commune]QPF92585.1 ABC transporter ATP-binding protein [Bradyrhizobium commune]
MSAVDIVARNVSKSYRVHHDGRRGRGLFGSGTTERFWALKNVGFEVRRGEALGVVGPNGSGKTTLIKLLARITSPDSGQISIAGRLMSLVEVGAGFHPELSGRDNVFLNAAIFGVPVEQVRKRFDHIVEFSGLADFIDAPVKTYSSGMFVRLGFAVASQLDADILLLDEVLAVGDLAFQARCIDRIAEIRRSGRTILLVSHDLAAVELLCDRVLLLASGKVAGDGGPVEMIERYQAMAATSAPGCGSAVQGGVATLEGVSFAGRDGARPRTGDPLTVRVNYHALSAVDDAVVTVSFIWPSGYICTELVSSTSTLAAGHGSIVFDCPMLAMQRGLYTVDLTVSAGAGRVLAKCVRAAPFRVDPGLVVHGDFHMTHSSRLEPAGT